MTHPLRQFSVLGIAVGMLLLLVIGIGCGEKLPLPTDIVDNPDGRLVDTVYLAIRPPWTEADGIAFQRPHGISVGYDRTLYVSDTENDRIVRLNLDGSFIESFDLPHPTAVAQDRGFNLISVGRSDTIWLRRYLDHDGFEPFIIADSVERCESVPRGGTVCFWERSNFFDVAASPELDRWYYVIDETYNLVRRFSVELPLFQRGADSGSAPGQVLLPLSIETGLSPEGYRVYVTQYSNMLGAQYLDGNTRQAVGLDDSADIFDLLPTGYKLIAADDLGNAYVLNQPTSEIIKFNRRGEFVLAFGRQGDDILSLQSPLDIAVLDETVYIADTDNNRIVRYRLATEPEG